MSHERFLLALIAAALLMQGCAGNPSRETSLILHRQQTGEGCATPELQSLFHALTPAKFLRSRGKQFEPWMSELRLQCPAAYSIDELYTATCKQSIAKVLIVLNKRLPQAVNNDRVRLEPRSGCVDTFLPGCESWDCSKWLEAVVPVAQ